MDYPPPPPLAPMYTSADTSALRGASFGQAVERFFKKYADFSGRASRSEYWFATLFTFLVNIVLNFMERAGTAGLLVSLVVSLALIVPGLSVAVRRLHDIGKSGWWLLLIFAIIVGWIILLVWYCTAEKPEGDKYNV